MNVRIEAIGETGLVVDSMLGSNKRASAEVPGGESAEFAVGGGQILNVRASANVAPAAEVPGISPLYTGVDVDPEPVAAEVADGADDLGFDPEMLDPPE